MQPTLNVLDICVTDLGAAIDFYRLLGLEFVPDPHMPSDHAGCDLPNGLHLMLDTDQARTKITAGWSAPSAGRTFLAFQLESPAAVDAKYAELAAAGVTELQEPWDAPWGMRYATVADPSGNGIDLYAILPTS
ncbi:VOC family protein [Kribbella deserti]|uniref:VOC family protein n=1 Tax=Kribbella deserti TaxID=1926257 RepID=A0ABV6QGU3_9ACTN